MKIQEIKNIRWFPPSGRISGDPDGTLYPTNLNYYNLNNESQLRWGAWPFYSPYFNQFGGIWSDGGCFPELYGSPIDPNEAAKNIEYSTGFLTERQFINFVWRISEYEVSFNLTGDNLYAKWIDSVDGSGDGSFEEETAGYSDGSTETITMNYEVEDVVLRSPIGFPSVPDGQSVLRVNHHLGGEKYGEWVEITIKISFDNSETPELTRSYTYFFTRDEVENFNTNFYGPYAETISIQFENISASKTKVVEGNSETRNAIFQGEFEINLGGQIEECSANFLDKTYKTTLSKLCYETSGIELNPEFGTERYILSNLFTAQNNPIQFIDGNVESGVFKSSAHNACNTFLDIPLEPLAISENFPYAPEHENSIIPIYDSSGEQRFPYQMSGPWSGWKGSINTQSMGLLHEHNGSGEIGYDDASVFKGTKIRPRIFLCDSTPQASFTPIYANTGPIEFNNFEEYSQRTTGKIYFSNSDQDFLEFPVDYVVTDLVESYGIGGLDGQAIKIFSPDSYGYIYINDIEIKPKKWFAYSNSKGQAVYDTSTGEQINDPF